MTRGVRLLVSGDFACFTRPEFKAERVSYEVMTPTAARGLLEAIYWKPEIRWQISAIHVLNHIKYKGILRNEVGQKAHVSLARRAEKTRKMSNLSLIIETERQSRTSAVLADVVYVIEAHFSMTGKREQGDVAARHIAGFKRRATRGQTFHQPYLGTREFAARFRLLTPEEPTPEAIGLSRDLGLMLYDIDHEGSREPTFFHAKLEKGILRIPSLLR